MDPLLPPAIRARLSSSEAVRSQPRSTERAERGELEHDASSPRWTASASHAARRRVVGLSDTPVDPVHLIGIASLVREDFVDF